tara:strand:- start:800 stop:1006 length:207 start_codon:yes stop_codon:yes gene_type:complete
MKKDGYYGGITFAYKVFRNDFNCYLKDNGMNISTGGGNNLDVYIVTPTHIKTKLTNYLNRQVLKQLKK